MATDDHEQITLAADGEEVTVFTRKNPDEPWTLMPGIADIEVFESPYVPDGVVYAMPNRRLAHVAFELEAKFTEFGRLWAKVWENLSPADLGYWTVMDGLADWIDYAADVTDPPIPPPPSQRFSFHRYSAEERLALTVHRGYDFIAGGTA